MIFRAMMFVMLPVAAMAQDCENATSQVEMGRCAGEALATADTELNTAWTAAMARMRQIDEDLPADQKGAADALRAAQRAWITVRDQGCAAAAWSYAGGTARPLVETQCKVAATQDRTAVLRDLAKRPDQ